MTKSLFLKLYHDAKEQPDRELYISEYGYPDYFDEISDNPDEVVKALSDVHKLAHMSFREFLAEANISQTGFARYFDIPLRTVQDWASGARRCPEYLKLMAAELLGVITFSKAPTPEIRSESVRRYADICKKFARESADWSSLSSYDFYTTDGSFGWKESSDNAHNGIDVSWAFGLSDSEIDRRAAEELLRLLEEEIRVAVDDGWDSEQIAVTLEKFDL